MINKHYVIDRKLWNLCSIRFNGSASINARCKISNELSIKMIYISSIGTKVKPFIKNDDE